MVASTYQESLAAKSQVQPTYCLSLWDHELGHGGNWSHALAAEFLEGPARGLSARETIQAVRRLRAFGWSELSIYASREN